MVPLMMEGELRYRTDSGISEVESPTNRRPVCRMISVLWMVEKTFRGLYNVQLQQSRSHDDKYLNLKVWEIPLKR
jgi:hypothetical protein